MLKVAPGLSGPAYRHQTCKESSNLYPGSSGWRACFANDDVTGLGLAICRSVIEILRGAAFAKLRIASQSRTSRILELPVIAKRKHHGRAVSTPSLRWEKAEKLDTRVSRKKSFELRLDN